MLARTGVMVTLLLGFGADVNAVSGRGATALQHSVFYGYMAVEIALLAAGPEVTNIEDAVVDRRKMFDYCASSGPKGYLEEKQEYLDEVRRSSASLDMFEVLSFCMHNQNQ